jgi:hypothetical protein
LVRRQSVRQELFTSNDAVLRFSNSEFFVHWPFPLNSSGQMASGAGEAKEVRRAYHRGYARSRGS